MKLLLIKILTMKMVLHILVVTTIFSIVTLHVEGMISKVNVLPSKYLSRSPFILCTHDFLYSF